jgi:CRP-like cAMP-binding protein
LLPSLAVKVDRKLTRRSKAYRRKMRAILRRVADGRGRVTTDLHHLAEYAGLGRQEARFALGDMERRGEIGVALFLDYCREEVIRLRPQARQRNGKT